LVLVLCAFVVFGPIARTVLAHGSGIWQEYSYLGGMDAIALGCLTALFLARRRLSRPALWIGGSLGLAFSIFSLAFSVEANAWGLGRNGLDMSILGLGTCLLIAVAAQTEWRAPRVLAPLLRLGQRSYEVYLTHMFVVFGLFHLFIAAGKPTRAVPALFLTVFACSAVLGGVIARFYSEPMNHWLRHRRSYWHAPNREATIDHEHRHDDGREAGSPGGVEMAGARVSASGDAGGSQDERG
jgi:peptidoglycan/LPS O-acetylase OafA/YrhL